MKIWNKFVYWLNERETLRIENATLKHLLSDKNKTIVKASQIIEKQRAKHEVEVISLKVQLELLKKE